MKLGVRPGAIGIALALSLSLAACGERGSTIDVRSSAFEDGDAIPGRHSCENDNVSPPLSWDGIPDDAVEVAIVVSDPDAPDRTFFHWVVVGIGANDGSVAEGAVPEGATQAKSSSDNPTYIGMCPPTGERHDYQFTVHALGEALADDVSQRPAVDVVSEIEDKSIARGSLTGTYGG